MSESQARSLAIADLKQMNGTLLSFQSNYSMDLPLEPAPVETHFPILNEDLAQLSPILQTLGLVAAFRPEGESTLFPLPGPAAPVSPWELPITAEFGPVIPLLKPSGRRHGHLGIISTHELPIECLSRLLEASLALAARAISERWFRLQHHKGWIVAVAPVDQPSRGFLLALDQRLGLRAMDAQASAWLEPRPTGSHRPCWEDFFRPITPIPTLRARADMPLRLIGARDGKPWNAILTGPDFNSGASSHDALLHARPRLHGLADLVNSEPQECLQIPSLTPGMRRKIEEYVEAHLDMQLSVERLAQAAGMSCSHFTRAFRNVLKMTPHRYVMWRRLMRAQELIRASDTSLAEIALQTGFSDQSHLCRLFQLHMSETPSRFRRRCR